MAEVYKTLNNLESKIADKRKLKNKSNSKKEAVKTYHKNEQTKVDKRIMTKRANNGNNSTSINKKDRYADLNQVIDNYLIKLSKSLKEIFGDFDDVFMQKSSEPKHLKNADKMASYMKIDKLTTYPFEEGYAPTQKDHEVMNPLMKRREKKNPDNSFYIRGHLLNDNIGGIGEWKNMTPLTRAANKQHEEEVESVLKKGVEKGKVYDYEVIPNYNRTAVNLTKSADETKEAFDTKTAIAAAEAKVPTELKITYNELRGENGKVQDKKTHTAKIPNDISPNKESKDYYLKKDKGTGKETPIMLDESSGLNFIQITELFEVSIDVANLIIDNIPYAKSNDLYTKILTKMNEDIPTYKDDISEWEKGGVGAIKKLYDDKKIKFSKKKTN